MNDIHLSPPVVSVGSETVRNALGEETDTVDLEVIRQNFSAKEALIAPMSNATVGNQIFLSYAREDTEDAVRVYRRLRESGLTVWFDRVALLPGQHWRVAVNDAIRQSKFFIQLLSSRSVGKHGVVQVETRRALDVTLEAPPGHIFILPVRLDDCQPLHEALHDLQWVDLFDDWGLALKKLIESMNLQASMERAHPPVTSAESALPEVLRYDGVYQNTEAIFRFFPSGEVTFANKRTLPQLSYNSLALLRARAISALIGTYTLDGLKLDVSCDIWGNFRGYIGVDTLSIKGRFLFSELKEDICCFQPFT